ncbi:MAG: hypothetical protein LBU06_02425 [Desulfovibrio sp.]|jgi:hypothetical protein|nr:hypothetical protein [Desulfovibrio sp.]
MWPFKPAWQSKNIAKALLAVEKLTEQTQLEQIARARDINPLVAIAALQKLTNQAVLADIARKSSNFKDSLGRNTKVCLAAVQRITDPTLLTNIIRTTDTKSISAAAKKVLSCMINENGTKYETVLVGDGYYCKHCGHANNFTDKDRNATNAKYTYSYFSCSCKFCHIDNHTYHAVTETTEWYGEYGSTTTTHDVCSRCGFYR